MEKVITTFLVGLGVGAVFGIARLPVPAPSALSGVMGIAGIYGGYRLVELVLQNPDKIQQLLPV
ncbi:MAG: DUF1427 family protein [Candidatus Nanohaloarchaeota archaeon QJJ-9]|nr:DUF1427 family protein [Candidatus Nanohaloarchaeota archaeon QJJ-9]